ncbi:hypothetical protein HNY73_007268 [Argiope bruennichi]|uniref:Uncharacterized protein n=1 Tax=Argiope bruennichi TaxID=94029 RepID=A0A8T0FDF5_ARGBR|nr:hypothetical protein HNY73_007268 [Argiope bruennichi]
MGRKGKARQGQSGTPSRGARASDSRTRPSESSARHADESKKKDSSVKEGTQSKKNTAGDQHKRILGKDKATDNVESEMPSSEKKTSDKNLQKSTDNPTGDNKATTKMELRSKGKEMNLERTPDLSKSDAACAMGFENASSKIKPSAHLCLAPPIQDNTKLIPVFEFLQGSKVKDTEEQKCKVDLKVTVIKKEPSSENERSIVEAKTEVNESISELQCSEGIEKQKCDSENLKTSEVRQELSSENEGNVIKPKNELDESTPMLQCSKSTDDPKGNLDSLKASEIQQELASEAEISVTESNTEVNESMSLFQSSKDIDLRKEFVNQNSPQLQLENISENQRKNSETKLEVNEATPVLQVPRTMDINERIKNLDLMLNWIALSKNWNKLSFLNTEEFGETIHLKKDANLSFRVR